MPEYISIPEAAQLKGCAETYLYRLIRKGRVHAVRTKRGLRISLATLAQLKGHSRVQIED